MKKSKQFISGFISATLIMVALISAVSFAGNQTVNAILSDIKIMLNGKEFIATNAKGEKLQPLIYNGSTYLPVKSISEAINLPVKWDPTTKTVFVGKVNVTDADTILSNIDYLSQSATYKWGNNPWANYDSKVRISKWDSSLSDNTGNAYADGLSFALTGDGTGATYGIISQRDYLLNMEYTKFTGKFVLDSRSKDMPYANAKFSVYGDDKLLYQSTSVTRGSLPVDFSVDVKNIIKLTIIIQNDSPKPTDMDYSNTVYYGVVNAGLYK